MGQALGPRCLPVPGPPRPLPGRLTLLCLRNLLPHRGTLENGVTISVIDIKDIVK